jgi:hypothetical protein
MREPVAGTFTVTGVVALGRHPDDFRAQVSGVLSAPGVPATAVTTEIRGLQWRDQLPSAGESHPALMDRQRPSRFQIEWPARLDPATREMQDSAYARQVAAAMRLGLDASVVPPASPPPNRMRGMVREMLQERVGNGPLPDGSAPISADEAAELKKSGEAATATVTGIDYLDIPAAALPSPEASIANVALEIRRADGSAYRALARFGFRTAARRAQVGFVGATVPVRIDPADPSRVALDTTDLPPV